MIVLRPAIPSTIQSLRDKLQRYVFGHHLDRVLLRNGVVVATGAEDFHSRDYVLAPRCAHITQNDIGFFEGPFSPNDLETLDLRAKVWDVETLHLDLEGAEVEIPASRRFSVRRRLYEAGKLHMDEAPGTTPDEHHQGRTISVQSFTPCDRWRPLLEARLNQSADVVAVAVTDGRSVVFGFPVFDILVDCMGWPPLNEGVSRLASPANIPKLEQWFVTHLLRSAREQRIPFAKIRPWPEGKSWAVMVRHDYDRLITDDEYSWLCRLYGDLDLRPNWFFLPHKSIRHQAQRLLKLGHEVALHTTAENGEEFSAQVRALSITLGRPVKGVTAHGGDYIGFLGDHQFHWAEKENLDYSESMSFSAGRAFIGVAGRAGETRPMNLVQMPSHSSLDAGTLPTQHRLDACKHYASLRKSSGECFVMMNHPDIHRPQIQQLFQSLDLSDAWRPTMPEMSAWCRATQSDLSYKKEGASVHVKLSQPLSQPAIVDIFDGAQTKEQRLSSESCGFQI